MQFHGRSWQLSTDLSLQPRRRFWPTVFASQNHVNMIFQWSATFGMAKVDLPILWWSFWCHLPWTFVLKLWVTDHQQDKDRLPDSIIKNLLLSCQYLGHIWNSINSIPNQSATRSAICIIVLIPRKLQLGQYHHNLVEQLVQQNRPLTFHSPASNKTRYLNHQPSSPVSPSPDFSITCRPHILGGSAWRHHLRPRRPL